MPADINAPILAVHKTLNRRTHPATIKKIIDTLTLEERNIACAILDLKTALPYRDAADIVFTSATTGIEFSASYYIEVCENYTTQEYIQYYNMDFNGRLMETEKFAQYNDIILYLADLNIILFKIGRVVIKQYRDKSFAKA